MPISGGKYVAPTWVNSTSPPIDADELQDICDSIEAYADPASTVPTIPNPNLLDNWYFVGGGSQQGGGQFPINTKGQTSYSAKGTLIDRWIKPTTDYTVSVTSGGLQITGNRTANQLIIQEVPIVYSGATVTLSVLHSGGFTFRTFALQAQQVAMETFTATISNETTHLNVGIKSNASTGESVNYLIYAIKLEIGDTQTLAHQKNGVWVLNEIPNYDIQFARCSELPSVPARYESGTYVGTGTIGSSNPNTLTFGFKPMYVMVTGTNSSGTVSAQFVSGMTTVSTRSSTAYTYNATWGDNSLSWYYNTTATSYAWRQMNASGVTYYYTAIG